jgi:hypothetical protein
MGYMVFTCLSISIIWHSDPTFHTERITPMISWSGVVVMMFAAIIPIAPRTMVLTGLVCVIMNPIAMLVLQRMGVAHWGGPGAVVLMHYPDFLLVGIAGAISGGHDQARPPGLARAGDGELPPR